jgi:thiol-disulfide isomerase/thioredoxin
VKRRVWGTAAVALAAGAAGVLWSQRKLHHPDSTEAGQVPPTDSPAEALWTQTVERVDGTSWPLQSLRGQRVVVNLWATWCPPCIREMPMLDRVYRAQPRQDARASWRLLGLAIDRRDAVARYLKDNPVSYDVAIAGMETISWSRSLGNSSGGLPFTIDFGVDGQIRHQKVGEITEAELIGWGLSKS